METKRPMRVMVRFMTTAMLLGAAMASASGQSSNRNVQPLEAKINAAKQYFAKTGSELFRSRGSKFTPPRVIMFSVSVQTACHELKAGNAFFCPKDNSIYLDSALLTTSMTEAMQALGTDGDYAAIVIGAHEYGHAIAAQSHIEIVDLGTFSAEQQADCFAGVITRQAKTDRLLEAGDLAEGLFSLAIVSDDAGGGMYRMLLQPLDHGIVESRQAAFLQGYYGGPGLCGLGAPKPPIAGRVIATTSLFPPSSIPPGKGKSCNWTNGPGGLRVHNLAAAGDCMFTLLPDSTMLPDHVRIELTVTRLPNGITGFGSAAGIFYGDARSTAALARFGFETDVYENQRTKTNDTNVELVNIDVGSKPIDVFGTIEGANRSRANILGENKLMLDVHHEGKDAYFVEYVNGLPTGFGHWQGGSSHLGVGDQVGVWLRHPGAEAIFKDFRVMVLPD